MKKSLKKLDNWVRRTGGMWLLILLLVLIIVALNIYVWLRYCSQADELKYFETHSFDALLAALLVPLLLSSIADAFKINEKFEAEKKQVEQEKRKRQIAAIEKTNALWSELYSLSTEVAYFKAGHGKASVRDIRKKLECFTNAAEEVVNLWYLNFSGVALEVETQSLPGLNLLLLSALTVADVVEDEKEEDAKQMQNCLLVIQDGVRFGLHYPLMQIFYLEMEKKKSDLKYKIANLREWGGFFKGLLKDQCPNLPAGNVTSEKRDAYLADLRKKCAAPKSVIDELAKTAAQADDPDETNRILESAEFKSAIESYNQAFNTTESTFTGYKNAVLAAPPNMLGLSRKRIFSNEQLIMFTRELYFQNDRIKIQSLI